MLYKIKIGEISDLEKKESFTPAFTKLKTEDLVIKDEPIPPKFVILVGGLASSGKTSHVIPLIKYLKEKLALTIQYLDKDLIGKTMPDSISSKIYEAMMTKAINSKEDVVIHEGNIIGNLSLFRDYISAQHKLGVKIICLDFQCSDPKMQHARLVERAAIDPDARQRDIKKLDFDYYIAIDRPGEIARRDKQIGLNKDLIDAGIINLKIIETATVSIHENVASIVECICKKNLAVTP